MKLSSALAIKNPRQVSAREIKVDFVKVFQGVGKGMLALLTQDWAGVAKEAVDTVAAFQAKDSDAALAWKLILGGLARASLKIMAEQAHALGTEPPDLKGLEKKVADMLPEESFELNGTFFENPANSAIFIRYQEVFPYLLMAHGLDEPAANAAANRLPAYFTLALHRVYQEDHERFDPLRARLDAPTAPAARREEAWLNYYAWLQRQVEQPVYGEPFSLRQLFVRLRGYYQEEEKASQPELRQEAPQKIIRRVVWLEEELLAWIKKAKRDDAIRAVCGGPGCGKSSSVAMLAARHCQNLGRRVLLIPLHLLDPEKDLVKAVKEFAAHNPYLPEDPLKPDYQQGERGILLILDGLDELTMRGKAAQDTAKDFVDEVRQQVARFNQEEPRLLVILTGRDLALSAGESIIRRAGKLLHVTPYLIDQKGESDREEKGQIEYQGEQTVLELDQRNDWWINFGGLSGQKIEQMPPELDKGRLKEITSQPLLNYLVALSRKRGKVDFSRQVNLNEVYQDLLEAVWERDYGQAKTLPSVQDLTYEEFARVLEEIALALWHCQGRSAPLCAIEERCDKAGIGYLLGKLTGARDKRLTGLMMAFYFRKTSPNQAGEDTFEFTHKSFGEYLVARALVRAVEDMVAQMAATKPGCRVGWGPKEALTDCWLGIAGPALVTKYIVEFIDGEVSLRDTQKPGLAKQWQAGLASLLELAINHGMPVAEIKGRRLATTRQEITYEVNASSCLWLCRGACVRQSKSVSSISWATTASLRNHLLLLHSREVFWGETGLLLDLSWLDINGQDFSFLIFFRATMENILANNCDFVRALFYGTVMRKGVFTNSNFYETYLRRADLTDANLTDANLSHANLSHANLTGANLSHAILSLANLGRAKLGRADLIGANLIGANLSRADLILANLIRANLSLANFSHANLSHANLIRANLTDANLTDADLSGADFTDAILTGADLSGADLSGAKLDGAKVTKAQLAKAQLK